MGITNVSEGLITVLMFVAFYVPPMKSGKNGERELYKLWVEDKLWETISACLGIEFSSCGLILS